MLKGQKYRVARLLRWTGRAIGTIPAVFFLGMLIGSAASEGVGSVTIETGTLVLLGVVALAGCIASWRRDMTAGILVLSARRLSRQNR
jgi:hypothetical protein